MAEDYTPNLDDGEMWLPPGIFPDAGVYRSHHRRPSSAMLCGLNYSSSDLASIEGLTRKFSVSGLQDRKQALFVPKKPPPNLSHPPQGFRPELQYESMAPNARVSYRGRGSSIALHGEGFCATGSMFPHQLNLRNPVRIQMERYTRARVSQRQQNQDQPRFFPGHVSGSGREYGGTGVFLPRVDVCYSRKRTTVKNEGENPNQPMRNGPVGQQGMTLQPQSEMGLPQDWTY